MVKWIIIAILLLPLAEIAAFILVAALDRASSGRLLLMLATTLAGFLVLRRAGRGRLARFRVAVADTDVAGIQANTGGFLTVLAGLLLFLPGFLTDLIGAALLIGPVRRWCGSDLPPLGAPPQSGRPLDHRSRAGRMAAGARPRAFEPFQTARPRLTSRPIAAFLSALERRVSHTARLRQTDVTVRRRVHREHHQRRPGRSPRDQSRRRSSRSWRNTSRISRSRIRTRRARCSSQPQPQINISGQRQRQAAGRHRHRGRAEARRQGRSRRHGAVQLRARLRRRVPHPERAAGAACSR